MFNLIDADMRLHYRIPNGVVIDAGAVQFETSWYDAWLEGMVSRNPEIIFFLTVKTTDVFEKETTIDYNTVVSMGDDAVLQHTYSEHCPAGCYGQLDDCHYKPKSIKPADRMGPEFNHGFHFESIFIEDSTKPPML